MITNPEKRILFLSHAYFGSCHDYKILKHEFDPYQGIWFDKHNVYVDMGFLGIQKDYDEQTNVPYRRSKKKELFEEQKAHNKALSQIRIKVEHAIGGMKRFRILSDRLRIKNYTRYNQVAGICAGLWNFMISY